MKQLPLSVLLACSAALTACGGAQDSNATQDKTLASTRAVVIESDAKAQTTDDTGSFAPRGYPEDRSTYQPASASAGN